MSQNQASVDMANNSDPLSGLNWGDRIWIGVGFVLTTILTSSITFMAQDRAAECQAVRNERLSEVREFRAIAVQFEPLVAAYMGQALRGQDAKSAKTAVIANLNSQRSKLAYIEPYLDKDGQLIALQFKKAAENFIVESNRNPTGVNVGPLYQELAHIFADSQDLIAATNRTTGTDDSGASRGLIDRLTNCAS